MTDPKDLEIPQDFQIARKSTVKYSLYQREMLRLGCLYSDLTAATMDECALASVLALVPVAEQVSCRGTCVCEEEGLTCNSRAWVSLFDNSTCKLVSNLTELAVFCRPLCSAL